jgi:hypothetical protein
MAKKISRKSSDPTFSGKRRMLPPLELTPTLQLKIRQFELLIATGYSDDTWNDAVYLLGQINSEAPLGVVEKLGSVWADAYVDPTGVSDKIDTVLREHYPSLGV